MSLDLDKYIIMEAVDMFEKMKSAMEKKQVNRVPFDDLTMFLSAEYMGVLEGLEEIDDSTLESLKEIAELRVHELSNNATERQQIFENALAEEEKKLEADLDQDKKDNASEYNDDSDNESADIL